MQQATQVSFDMHVVNGCVGIRLNAIVVDHVLTKHYCFSFCCLSLCRHVLSKIKGICAEDGGMLSRAASVARELEIPAVVGATNATKHFQDGDFVQIDGYVGSIKPR